MQALMEFQKQARLEKWALLADRLVVTHRNELREQVRLIIAAYQAATRAPTLQQTLPTHIFLHMSNCLGICHAELSVLASDGIVRREGGAMQIWAADSALKTEPVKTLVSYARLFEVLVARGEFALRLPMQSGIACCPMTLTSDLTIEGLKGIAAAAAGIPMARQRMTHLGSDLLTGKLVDNGIGHGSCVIVAEIIDC